MNSSSQAISSVDLALSHTKKLLDLAPKKAIEQANEILAASPNHPHALLLLAIGLRKCGEREQAHITLTNLAQSQPYSAEVHYHYALSLAEAGLGLDAIAALKHTLSLNPKHTEAWRMLGDHLHTIGESEAADSAYKNHVKTSTNNPALMQAAAALYGQHIPEAEALLRKHLAQSPTDVVAIRMLAEVASRVGRSGDAEQLLFRCLELSPGFTAARQNYALVLYRNNKLNESIEQLDTLMAEDKLYPGNRNLRAVVLSRIGDYDEAVKIYEKLLNDYPKQAKIWHSYGHALKAAGNQKKSIDSYKKCIALTPQYGEAYWSLANLKTFRFTEHETNTMLAHLENVDLSDHDRYHFEFALGKAYEDSKNFKESFDHYHNANSIRKKSIAHNRKATSVKTLRSKDIYTKQIFRDKKELGFPANDPIFIIGMPRAGSTLLEQILSSHSLVEGTMELPEVINIATEIRKNSSMPESNYHETLLSLNASELRNLGEKYLERTKIQRKSDKPYFIDKMPNNFTHIGLIHMMLPNAKIIDARRHPMSCCFSGYKQHFARGQSFSYNLKDIGQYYSDYVNLMSHFDQVLPGRIHRVFYENMVENTELEIRRLLEYCGLPFEEQCLRFFENERPVRTPSSEQVRSPIYKEGVNQWRNYEPWLDDLKQTLGNVIDTYPDTPTFN
ncbi:sulfotransferase [Dasania marina]|mgnify:CR=1 FL=1|uniref:tetratricopeptide repeat-containing sulfotransferase family protein n=1 Tax=Dasania marina TaxID=471499 RepID=UPI0030D94794|tara:strand:+ start:30964 stop:32982 length:2019 start_codon:yes stop_codon:yes gene_type:complete